MGLLAMGGSYPALDTRERTAGSNRRLRANEPGSLLSGPAAGRPIALAQAYLAAGRSVPTGSIAYLQRLRRPDGSFRYSKRYATTPVWVTAQVLPALARKPFPLRPNH